MVKKTQCKAALFLIVASSASYNHAELDLDHCPEVEYALDPNDVGFYLYGKTALALAKANNCIANGSDRGFASGAFARLWTVFRDRNFGMALFGLLLMSTLSVQAQVARVVAPISPVTPIAAAALDAPADAAAQVEQWRLALDAESWTPDLHRDSNDKGNLLVGGVACGILGAKSKRIVLDFPDSGGLHTVRQYRGDASKFCTPEGIGKITFTDGSTWYGQVGNRVGLWNRVLPYPDGLGELSGGAQDHVLMIARPDEDKAWGWHVERELFNYSAYQARLEYERLAAEQEAQERARVERAAAQATTNTPAKRLSTLCPDGHDCTVIN